MIEMSETVTIWMEVSFNIVYLILVWGLVIAMYRQKPGVPGEDQPVAVLFVGAFFVLALGDTGHVGFRVLAFGSGGLDKTVHLFGQEVGLVGFGALSTSLTVTLFYLFILMIWQRRFGKEFGLIGTLLWLFAIARFVIMLFPQNEWNNVVPPQPWSLYRNLPLTFLGLGVAGLILRDGLREHDTTFVRIGYLILFSYAMYLPVILFIQSTPLVGMLMIPKTLAYLAIAFIAYLDIFTSGEQASQPARVKQN
jgi:hypothetical protein